MGTQTATTAGRRRSRSASSLRFWLLLSGACLVGQVVSTDYGVGTEGQAWFWLLVGVGMLWLVAKRRSRVARGFIVVTALMGAVLYVAADPAGLHAWTLTALYLGQALPLLAPVVRNHVTVAPADSSRLPAVI